MNCTWGWAKMGLYFGTKMGVLLAVMLYVYRCRVNVDICDTLPPLNWLKDYKILVCVLLSTYVTDQQQQQQQQTFFSLSPPPVKHPAGPQTKGLVKQQADFP